MLHLRLRRSWPLLAIMLLAATIAAATPRHAAAAADERCFSETGFCISGRFREFWETQGGLGVFGLPLGPEKDGVQLFERNRFEFHEGNDPPFDVLLSRLGSEAIGDRWQTDPKGDPNSPWYLPSTGMAIAPQFRSYWCNHGLSFIRNEPLEIGGVKCAFDPTESLMLFGVPISAAKMETNSSGESVLTQWFERSRFEYIPGNADPFKVLLGRLGAEAP